MQSVIQKHDNIKINTIFNSEFVSGEKRANKSVSTRNYELFRSSDLEMTRVARSQAILTSLEEFQDSVVDAYPEFNCKHKQV